MTKTKIALAAALIAAFASPALAQGLSPTYNYPSQPSYATQEPFAQEWTREKQAPRVIERRNAADIGNFGAFNASPTSRDAMVNGLGN
jgi:hypothetical protein